MGDRKDDDDEDDEDEGHGLLGILSDVLKGYNDEREKLDQARGAKKEEDKGGAVGGLIAAALAARFHKQIRSADDALLDWELAHEKKALEIERIRAERQRYTQRPQPKDDQVSKIIDRLRREVRDRSALIGEQEKLIAEVTTRRRGAALTEDDLRDIENIKDAVTRYLDELAGR